MRVKEDKGMDTGRDARQMPEPRRRGERLTGLLLAGLALLNFPLLSICSVKAVVFGIPALYIYLFSVWSLIIGITAFVLRRRRGGGRSDPDEQDIEEP